jgi:hypothetical protein
MSSLAPMSGGSGLGNTSGTGEVLAATMAKKQQKMEGAAAMQLLETAGQVATPKPMGASGGHINVMV